MESSIKKRVRSFRYAFLGIKHLYTQPNAWIQTAIAAIMITMGIIIGFEIFEWLVIIICIGAVLTAEAFNTAIENLCDRLHPLQNPLIGRVKDISAGAVLIISISSAVCGILILVNHYYDLF